jgi:hypothetical protein
VQIIFKRLLAWLSGRPDAADRKHCVTFNESAIDLDEFARLLNSRDLADLKAIARAMSKSKDISKQP